jgi:hypothetical protein
MKISRLSGIHVGVGALLPLKKVLLVWQVLMEEDWGKDDASWWYNE